MKFDEQEDYIGNIWGWKWSFIGLAFMLFIMSIMAGRYYYLKSNGLYKGDTPQDFIKIEQVD